MRFSELPISAMMSSLLPIYGRSRHLTSANSWMLATNYPQFDLAPALMQRILHHTSYAARRRDGTRTIAIDLTFGISQNHGCRLATRRDGKPDYTWYEKDLPPARVMAPGEEPPESEIVSANRTNMCPIMYTRKRGEVAPNTKLTDAILTHLVDNGLHLPTRFLQPREYSFAR